jgi:hypothetical protein
VPDMLTSVVISGAPPPTLPASMETPTNPIQTPPAQTPVPTTPTPVQPPTPGLVSDPALSNQPPTPVSESGSPPNP